MLIVLVINFVVIVAALYIGFIRNDKVYNYRNNIIQMVFEGNDNQKIQERLKYFHSVGYDEMVWKVWKPIDSFYDMERFK